MKLLMINGDRSVLRGRKSAFWYTLEELSTHWDRIDVICPKAVERPAFRIEDDGSYSPMDHVYFHPSPHGLWHQSRWILRRGAMIVEREKTDVMTVHEYPPFYNGVGAARLSKATGIPYALEIHHIVGYPHASSIVEYIGRFLSWLYLRFDVRHAAGIRTVNEHVRSTLIRWQIPGQNIQVVPSFYLDPDMLKSVIQIPKAWDVSFCGRLVENKGVKELIDAVHRLPQVRLLVVGDGPRKQEYEQYAIAQGLKDRVMFTGWLPGQREVVEAIGGARVFVMNSKSEGGPRVLLEAMSAGMPVISTRVGVAPDVIDEGVNGLFTDGTAADLAEKIIVLLKDEVLREQMGKHARGILKKYDRKTLIKKYAKFLQSFV